MPELSGRISWHGSCGDEQLRSVPSRRYQLKMRLVRFRLLARFISHSSKSSSEALEAYLLTTMTAEMVARNTTSALVNMDPSSDKKSFVEVLSTRSSDGKGRRVLENKLTRADAGGQAQTAWEAGNPTPTLSYYGKARCTTIQSMVTFKLASVSQHRQDREQVYNAGFLLQNATPVTT